MDINTLRSIATPLAFIALVAIAIWTFSKSKKKDFDEAANLPFAEDDDAKRDPSVEKNK
ncbi:cbb3-type cytochrome c oxidase subunit 3 [Maribrevibacterium harenarium]|jgi:cytochrome c oxidase cbb3-type subunit 4|uniref:Cbb3-type cytochrome c oxidase subunit 3 n=1 Tax=Maribrevibacterium harenarium TaxID=2589817 RepID=A0A501X4W9_9GAMM|nr:cbb3-type cytochrome c oxidase subunit 3 [Maribrevibacterium harenarium]TPE55556.1 cbb3-type cytochrome c oxidase subunit 3 [Maribrevibacterium harenarium]